MRGCIGLGFGQTAFLSAAAEAGEYAPHKTHAMYIRLCVCTHDVYTTVCMHSPVGPREHIGESARSADVAKVKVGKGKGELGDPVLVANTCARDVRGVVYANAAGSSKMARAP